LCGDLPVYDETELQRLFLYFIITIKGSGSLFILHWHPDYN